jgi:hypothetical protein
MKVLDLVLTYKWYDMIDSGKKREEYREAKPYWMRRFCTYANKAAYCYCAKCPDVTFCEFECKYDTVRFRRGYTSESMTFKLNDVTYGIGNPRWGAPDHDVFILKLGERL